MGSGGWGALSGVGRGIAGYGEDMARNDEYTRRLQEQEASRLRLQDDRQAAAIETAVSRATARSGAAPGVGALQIAADPEKFALLSGMSRSEVDDALAMARGQDPRVSRVAPGPTEDGSPLMIESAKYTPGQAQALRERAREGLREAMKVANPANADEVAKSQREDQTRGFLSRAAEGDQNAVDAALVSQGKDPTVGDAAMRRADKAGSGRGGSGGAGSVQKTVIDSDGNIVAIMRDGTTRKLGIRAGEFSKRVDALAKNLAKSIDYIGKPFAEVRAEAERIIAAGGSAPAPAAPASRPPLSSFKR